MMAHGRNRAPFRKRFLAKYVLWLEAAGFLFIGILIAGMVGSAVYKIDDVMKFSGVTSEERREIVAVPIESYVNSVMKEEGANVEQGQELMRVTGSAQTSALLKAINSIEQALEALQGDSAKGDLEIPLKNALSRSLSILEKEASHPILAPISGTLKSGEKYKWQTLSGKVISGTVGYVMTFDSLRFEVPVAGDNAARVRINLLAEEDVKDWKLLTSLIKSEHPLSDPVKQRIRDLLADKLEEIKPGKRPMKRNMPEVVGALNDLLRRRDFYVPDLWSDRELGPDAQVLLKGNIETLNEDDLIRLNRILLDLALSEAISPARNSRQQVKAKLYIPVEEKGSDGKMKKGKPRIFTVRGEVVHEPSAGKVVIDLSNPPADVVEYMKRRSANPALESVTASGNIVVGRISLFRFLFK